MALIAGPIVGGFVFAALGLGVALSAAAAAFALSWTLLPLLMLGGLPLLVGAALFGGERALGHEARMWGMGMCGGNTLRTQTALNSPPGHLTGPPAPCAAGLWVPVGGLLIANLFKLGALGAALWLGAKFAQTVLGTGASSDGRTRWGVWASRLLQ